MWALDKMICDGEPEFLNARNLKKLEQMTKDARAPLVLWFYCNYVGS